MADLFDPEPEQWGLRGDPHVWHEMRRRLRATEQPARRADAVRLLHSTFLEIVGVELHGDREAESVYNPAFDSGGMSGGHVDLLTWRERLMPLLESRLSSEP